MNEIIDIQKNISKVDGRGGARPGAGRPPGRMNKTSLEKMKVKKALEQKIMQKANRLLRAMMASAEGESFLYRKDIEFDENSKKIVKHNLVTNPKEIEDFLDEYAEDDKLDGLGGDIDETYYYIKTKPADWKAIESLFDRVFGKSKQSVEVENITPMNEYEQLSDEQLERQLRQLESAIEKAKGNTSEEG